MLRATVIAGVPDHATDPSEESGGEKGSKFLLNKRFFTGQLTRSDYFRDEVAPQSPEEWNPDGTVQP